MTNYKDRIISIDKMRIGDIEDNQNNWRTHPEDQKRKFTGILDEVGQAGVVLAYYSERNGGKLTFIDGHLRKEMDPDREWHVAITDLNDAEADKLLLSYDYITSQAGTDPFKLKDLVEDIRMNDPGARDVWHDQSIIAEGLLREMNSTEDPGDPIEAMELLPFEHYDYVVLLFKQTFDWERAVELLGLEKVSSPINTKKIGLGRAIDGAVFLELLEKGRKSDL